MVKKRVRHTVAIRCKQGWVIISGRDNDNGVEVTKRLTGYSRGLDSILTDMCYHDLIGKYSDNELYCQDNDYVKFE